MKVNTGLCVMLLTLVLLVGSGCGGERTPGVVLGSATPPGTESGTATANAPAIPPVVIETGEAQLTPTFQMPTTQPGAGSIDPAEIAGLKVAFTKDKQIWLWAQDQTRQLTSSGEAFGLRISGDGQMIAYIHRVDADHAELWVVNTDGGSERRLVGVDALNAIGEGSPDPDGVAVSPHQFEWIPGTHILAYNTHWVYDGPGLALLDDLQQVNADTGDRWTLLEPGQGGRFVYSPDASQIAIIAPDTISLMNPDASNWRTTHYYDQVNTYSEYRYYARPVWSSDSKYLRVAIPPSDPLAGSLQPTSLWWMPVDGAPAVRTGEIFAVPFFDTPVTFSPDLSYLSYLQETGQPGENLRKLHIARSDGSEDQLYQEYYLLRFVAWSGDGGYFNFTTGQDQLMLLGSLGGNGAKFTEDPYGIQSVRWLDDQLFIYAREVPGGFELRLGSMRGGEILLDTVSGPPPHFDYSR